MTGAQLNTAFETAHAMAAKGATRRAVVRETGLLADTVDKLFAILKRDAPPQAIPEMICSAALETLKKENA
jgi:hypothetical protein